MAKRKTTSPVLFELPQLSFDLSEGRPRILTSSSGHYRLYDGMIYRYGGRSRWLPDIAAPTVEQQQVREQLLAHPTLYRGEACVLLTA